MVKRSDRIRITSNWKLLIVILILIIFLIVLIYFTAKGNREQINASVKECSVDGDCVAATCCHPDSCVPLINKPDCKEILCSMDLSGPLEDGTGHCGCVKGKCSVISKK